MKLDYRSPNGVHIDTREVLRLDQTFPRSRRRRRHHLWGSTPWPLRLLAAAFHFLGRIHFAA